MDLPQGIAVHAFYDIHQRLAAREARDVIEKEIDGGPPIVVAEGSRVRRDEHVVELTQRMIRYSQRLLGEFALLERRSPFAPDGDWLRRILYSESMTIAGGTSPVQKNMIGERILQLPKG